VVPPAADQPLARPALEVVRHLAWVGVRHTELHGALVSLLHDTWKVARVTVDATGIGEPVAAFLRGALGPSKVEGVKLSAETKSRLGYEALAAVNGGRVRLYEGASPERDECWRQLQCCRAVYRPNRSLNYFVEARDGHDDYVISLVLAIAAATESGPRRARGRLEND
jgi:hypothetical protein